MAQMIASTAEWQSVKDAMVEAYNAGGDQQQIVDAGLSRLREVGLGGESVLASIPPKHRQMMSDEDAANVVAALDQYMIASVAQDIVTGSPLPIAAFAGDNVSVEHVDHDGVSMAVVHAYATSMGNPEDTAARFIATCYQNFEPETFAHRPNGGRDAEWWRRHRQGEGYREIALADERSGVTPEARVDPKTYADEVRRGTDRVRRAVIRFAKRWTQKIDSVSKESE